jgi:hypothetical protein
VPLSWLLCVAATLKIAARIPSLVLHTRLERQVCNSIRLVAFEGVHVLQRPNLIGLQAIVALRVFITDL